MCGICGVENFYRQKRTSEKGCWQELSFQIPSWEGALIGEMGVCFDLLMGTEATQTFAGLLDDLWADGTPDYRIDFARKRQKCGLAYIKKSASLPD